MVSMAPCSVSLVLSEKLTPGFLPHGCLSVRNQQVTNHRLSLAANQRKACLTRSGHCTHLLPDLTSSRWSVMHRFGAQEAHNPALTCLSSICTCCRFEKMALMLLHERHKGKDSAVSGYIEQLPTAFNTLLHWSPEELQLLMYPHLLQQVGLHVSTCLA